MRLRFEHDCEHEHEQYEREYRNEEDFPSDPLSAAVGAHAAIVS